MPEPNALLAGYFPMEADMADDFEERVRARAFHLWQEEGCPEGRADVHWDKARELVAIEDNYELALKPVNEFAQRLGPYGEPIEELIAVENEGEFPTLTDQGEEQTYPSRQPANAGDEPQSSR
jgi:hypothetical protein